MLKEKMKEKEKKNEDDDSEEEDDSLSDPLDESDDSELSESESSPEKPKKGKKKNEEITEADRRNSKVCAFDPCERQENCGFVHVKSGTVSANYTNERNPNRIYYRGGSESETSETATERKEYDGEGGPILSPEGNCQGGGEEGCEGSHERDEKEEVDELVYLLNRCNFINNKEIKELIRGCDDLINGIESDLAFARSGLKGSKRNKRSKYYKEIRQLIRDCDDLIDGLESDLALARCGLKGSKRNKGSKYEIRQLRKGAKRQSTECTESERNCRALNT